nr:cadherin-like protein 26 [Paramormyrops kingsleyae]
MCFQQSVGLFSTALAEALIRHKRSWIIAYFQIEEEHPGPYPIELGAVAEVDAYHVLKVYGKGVDEEPRHVFDIDRKTGIVNVYKKIDYETHKKFLLIFEINNKTSHVETRLAIDIVVKNINDNSPQFPENTFTITVNESTHQGTYLTTVTATDRDEPGIFLENYRIASQVPKSQDMEFLIGSHGQISFRGCLNYQEVEKYTIVVEAEDHGKPSLTGTCTVTIQIEDQNNHLPFITGYTGIGRVKENVINSAPFRIHVKDKDKRNSAAWRAKYSVHGDDGEHFRIETDPETNDGILSVIKPLDFEKGMQRKLSISVMNEALYFTCTSEERDRIESQPKNVTIIVEDVNDPPEFLGALKEVFVEENIATGYLLERFTAVDRDVMFSNKFVYKIGKDPACWVTVDPKTCEIRTAKIMDRESRFVVNGTYTVIVHAVDEGNPRMTGTATLKIHLKDQNDNVPQLSENMMQLCLSDEANVVNITAYDLDGDPYSGPFHFELLGDVKGRWRLDPSFGTSVKLVKESLVCTGKHRLFLRISDQQGLPSLQNLSVTVCHCIAPNTCHRVMSAATRAGLFGVIFAAIFLLLASLLLILLITRGKQKAKEVLDSEFDLLPSRTEELGDDCEVPNSIARKPIRRQVKPPRKVNYKPNKYLKGNPEQNVAIFRIQKTLGISISKKICSIQDSKNELSDYDPHVYADEGSRPPTPDLDSLSISEPEFDPEQLLDLGPCFNSLAAISWPELVTHNISVATYVSNVSSGQI